MRARREWGRQLRDATLAGGAIGAAAGYAAMIYMNWFPADQASFYIPASAGGFALILGLAHLFHYDTQ